MKGRLKMVTKDGEEVYEAGQAFYWPPGHAPVIDQITSQG